MSRNKCFSKVRILHVLRFMSICDLCTEPPPYTTSLSWRGDVPRLSVPRIARSDWMSDVSENIWKWSLPNRSNVPAFAGRE
jgi:hypothetical protein